MLTKLNDKTSETSNVNTFNYKSLPLKIVVDFFPASGWEQDFSQ